MLEFTGERIVPQADNCEPNFASRMMHEHLARYLFAGQIVAGKAVLDVGCGVGYGAQKLGQLGAASVFAFDISADAIAHAREFYAHPAVRFGTANAEDFELDEQFDVVTCFEMIEHVEHPDRVLDRIARHLRESGTLVASTPRFLGEKRTHFHVREFSLDEYRELLGQRFDTTRIYCENNHFVSAVTDGEPTAIDRIETLKAQFVPDQADVFISVSALATGVRLPDMQPSLVLDDDSYVRMLEQDVAILHKAEDDLRAVLVAEREAAEDVRRFQAAEIGRLEQEYGEVFRRAEGASAKLWRADQDLAALRLAHDQACAEKDAEVARLVGEHNALFARFEAESGARFELEQALARHRLAAEQESATKDAEIARLVGEYNALFSRAEAASAAHAEDLSLLTADAHNLRAELEMVTASLKDAEMKFAELQDNHDKLHQSLEALTVRADDADARRLEAYEFARSSSENALALRRELDILKRDLQEALDAPETVVSAGHVDHRHRAIVESMERIFVGTAATHPLVRDPVVLRVGRLAGKVSQLSAELAARQAELDASREEAREQRTRAEQGEAFAEDWHAQILRLRNSASWKLTKPLRAVGRIFR